MKEVNEHLFEKGDLREIFSYSVIGLRESLAGNGKSNKIEDLIKKKEDDEDDSIS